MKSKVVNPQAAALIWNYEDRINASGAQDPHKVEQVIINTASVISISTQKAKSSPAGSFEIHLAPTFNWVARITPGSWVAILMTQDRIIEEIDKNSVGQADARAVKMLGRIDSVRAVVDVDQSTGARKTQYIASGQDWGCIFDSILYMDPIIRNSIQTDSPVGQAARIIFNNMILEWTKNNIPIPTPASVIQAIVTLWGNPAGAFDLGSVAAAISSTSPSLQVTAPVVFSSVAKFQMPQEVKNYFGFSSTEFSSIISKYHGKLSSYDTYTGDQQESFGMPDPAKFFGMHTFWQLLMDNANTIVNELVTDMRWENGKAKLALYNRSKPFINRQQFDGAQDSEVQKSLSMFKNVRKVDIPLEDVLSFNAGTNLRDKVNFVEMRLGPQLSQEMYEAQIKLTSQITDTKSYEREGFKPMMPVANYLPYKDGAVGAESALDAMKWKFLLKEWYFNTHLMLNGAVSFIGQNQYIQVGDNIMIDAAVMGNAPTNASQSDQSFLLAHVESVSHNFTVDSLTGARSFITTVQFVRGIIANQNGTMVGTLGGALGGLLGGLGGAEGGIDGALDRSASSLPTSKEKNRNVLGSSTIIDIDKDKLKGS